MSIFRQRSLLLPVVFLLVLLTGCDTLDPGEEGVVAEHEQEFRFETTAAQLSNNAAIAAQSGLDVASTLAGLGFSKGDIVNAEVVSAELSRVTPLTLSLSEILSAATVRLSGGGNSTTVAQAASIGSGTSTQMQPAGGDIGSFARASTAGVTLTPTAVDDLPPGNYVFRVRLRVRLTLEGI